jgi:hypothetical protein
MATEVNLKSIPRSMAHAVRPGAEARRRAACRDCRHRQRGRSRKRRRAFSAPFRQSLVQPLDQLLVVVMEIERNPGDTHPILISFFGQLDRAMLGQLRIAHLHQFADRIMRIRQRDLHPVGFATHQRLGQLEGLGSPDFRRQGRCERID